MPFLGLLLTHMRYPTAGAQVDAAKSLALYTAEGMQPAVRRYETQWLPLLAKYRDVKSLAAPTDVAWVWLMHALAPAKYHADVLRISDVSAANIQADSPQHQSAEAMTRVMQCPPNRLFFRNVMTPEA